MKFPSAAFWIPIAVGCFIPLSAQAQNQVFLNGIEISGTKNQIFSNVTVAFDTVGNISITAPQYKVLEQPQSSTVAPSPTQPAQVVSPSPVPVQSALGTLAAPSIPKLPNPEIPTYLLAIFNAPGLLGYNVEVLINGSLVRTLTQGRPTQSFDVSQYLIRGTRNTLQYRLVMTADSGTSSKATVQLSLAKAATTTGNAVELSGEYAPIEIKGIDGAKTYTVQIDVP